MATKKTKEFTMNIPALKRMRNHVKDPDKEFFMGYSKATGQSAVMCSFYGVRTSTPLPVGQGFVFKKDPITSIDNALKLCENMLDEPSNKRYLRTVTLKEVKRWVNDKKAAFKAGEEVPEGKMIERTLRLLYPLMDDEGYVICFVNADFLINVLTLLDGPGEIEMIVFGPLSPVLLWNTGNLPDRFYSEGVLLPVNVKKDDAQWKALREKYKL